MKDKYFMLAIEETVQAFDDLIELVSYEQDLAAMLDIQALMKQMIASYLEDLEKGV